MPTDTLRERIRNEITGIVPFDAAERDVISDTLKWLDSGAEILPWEKPAIPPKHLVSYFLLVDDDHVLLVDHINAGLWLPSGGHVEPGEHPKATVEREIVEELGIPARFASPDPQFITATTTVGSTPDHVDVSLWYVVLGDRSKPLDYDRTEFNQERWFPRNNVPQDGCEPELGRFLAKMDSMGFR